MGMPIRFAAMSWWNRKWLAGIRERFNDREDIGREAVYDRYFASERLPRVEVYELFDLIESEYGPIAGLLRPDDNLVQKLFTPVKTNNPFRSVTYDVRAGDRELWIGDKLKDRLEKYGVTTHADWRRIQTVKDLVNAWCGRIPISTE